MAQHPVPEGATLIDRARKRDAWIRRTLGGLLCEPGEAPICEAILALDGIRVNPARGLESIAHALIVAAYQLRTTEP